MKKLNLSRKDMVRLGAPVVVLALIASVVTGREKPSEPAQPVVQAAARTEPARVDAAAAEDLDLSLLARPQAELSKADPFARLEFRKPEEPAGAAAAPAAPAKPVAPPLPFTYVGKLIDGDSMAVFVAQGETNHVLKQGAKLGDYRVDKVTETGVSFTYLPLKTKQHLPIPAASE